MDDQTPSKRTLLEASAIAAVVATIVLVLFILPAEYSIDPTGFGEAIGIQSIAAPEGAQAATHTIESEPFQNDTITIVVPGFTGLEYKLNVEAGSSLVYAWSATAPLYVDFHGEPFNDTSGYFESYQTGTMSDANGAFQAPFAGTHGWYFRNDSSADVWVTLDVAGYYSIYGIK